MRTIAFCLLISYIGIWASCNKHFDCRGTIYSFETFFKAYPDRDSIHVNDTIWFELAAPTQLQDLISNKVIDYSGAANFGTVLGYVELTGGDSLNPGAIPAANDFENIIINGYLGASLSPERTREFLFKEENGMYLFKVGIVPKRRGLFMIGIQNAANVYQKKNRCEKSNIKLTFKDTDQHLYLYEQKRPGYVLSDSDLGHLYAFKVY